MADLPESEDLPVSLAADLRDAGLRWKPAPGDRFVVTTGTLDGEVFTVSDMVVEVVGQGGGDPVLGFNGTTEWALDSVAMDAALWLPREGQLRRLLGRAFRRLDTSADGFRVTIAGRPAPPSVPSSPHADPVDDAAGDSEEPFEEVFQGTNAAEAYGRALAAFIGRALS